MRRIDDRWTARVLQVVAWGLVVIVAAACGGGPPAPPPETAESASGPARPGVPLLAPTDAPAESLPPGHPPIEGGAVPAAPPADGGGLVWDVPANWVAEPPASSMRRAQYRVPGPGGDGECVVFYFGPGQGGDPMSNAVRWAEQFTQPDGRASTDVMQTGELEVNGMPVLTVEVTGTYTNRMVSDVSQPGHMLLGAVVSGPDAGWFFKLTGPEATVRDQREAFDGLVRSVRPGG